MQGLHDRSVSGRAYNDNKRGCMGSSREQSYQREGWRCIRDINTRCSLSSINQVGVGYEARACKVNSTLMNTQNSSVIDLQTVFI